MEAQHKKILKAVSLELRPVIEAFFAVSGETSRRSMGTLKDCSQNRSPLSTAVIRVSIPPWLWPTITILRRASSLPSGSNS